MALNDPLQNPKQSVSPFIILPPSLYVMELMKEDVLLRPGIEGRLSDDAKLRRRRRIGGLMRLRMKTQIESLFLLLGFCLFPAPPPTQPNLPNTHFWGKKKKENQL